MRGLPSHLTVRESSRPLRADLAWAMQFVCLACVTATAFGQETPPAVSPKPLSEPDVSMTERGTVEMHVANVPLSTVLRLLSTKGQRNIIASPDVRGTVTADFYNTKFEDALNAVLVSNGAGYRTVGNFIYVHSTKELEEIAAKEKNQAYTRVFPLNYLTAEDAKTYVALVLEKDGTVAASTAPAKGLESSVSDAGGASSGHPDFLVVTAKPETMNRVANLLKELDVRPKQVLIESTILRASLKDDNALGIDFTLVGGVDLELLGAQSTGVQDVTLGNLPRNRFELGNAAASTDFRGNVPSGGLTFGIIKDQVAVFVRALEQVTDTVVVANPKLLALNKQKGQVIVGRRDGYLTTTVTETQAVQTVQFLETGTALIFRPFVSDDGFIRVELHPKDSVGFVSAQGLPSEQTTEVTTNVILRDGETILIGGLFREVTTDSKSQVPWLGSLPIVGLLFRSTEETSEREEVIILLTIHVIADQQKLVDASREALEDVERLRVGTRQGLMGTGRERLAQSNYRLALEAHNAGNRERALWYADMSIQNLPRFLPAIELKERITGERAWDEDATGGREFLHRLIAQERGYPLPWNRKRAIPNPAPPDQRSDAAIDTRGEPTPVNVDTPSGEERTP